MRVADYISNVIRNHHIAAIGCAATVGDHWSVVRTRPCDHLGARKHIILTNTEVKPKSEEGRIPSHHHSLAIISVIEVN